MIIGEIAGAMAKSRVFRGDPRGALTFLLCFGSLWIPLSFLRVWIAGAAAIVLKIAWKAVAER